MIGAVERDYWAELEAFLDVLDHATARAEAAEAGMAAAIARAEAEEAALRLVSELSPEHRPRFFALLNRLQDADHRTFLVTVKQAVQELRRQMFPAPLPPPPPPLRRVLSLDEMRAMAAEIAALPMPPPPRRNCI